MTNLHHTKWWKTEAISSKVRLKQACPLSLLLFNTVLEFQPEQLQAKEINRIQVGEEEVNLYLFADDMILYLKDPKDST
jgi:hypothetical protein